VHARDVGRRVVWRRLGRGRLAGRRRRRRMRTVVCRLHVGERGWPGHPAKGGRAKRRTLAEVALRRWVEPYEQVLYDSEGRGLVSTRRSDGQAARRLPSLLQPPSLGRLASCRRGAARTKHRARPNGYASSSRDVCERRASCTQGGLARVRRESSSGRRARVRGQPLMSATCPVVKDTEAQSIRRHAPSRSDTSEIREPGGGCRLRWLGPRRGAEGRGGRDKGPTSGGPGSDPRVRPRREVAQVLLKQARRARRPCGLGERSLGEVGSGGFVVVLVFGCLGPSFACGVGCGRRGARALGGLRRGQGRPGWRPLLAALACSPPRHRHPSPSPSLSRPACDPACGLFRHPSGPRGPLPLPVRPTKPDPLLVAEL
jgi:hypothetical protein